jgi:hypothetical protein
MPKIKIVDANTIYIGGQAASVGEEIDVDEETAAVLKRNAEARKANEASAKGKPDDVEQRTVRKASDQRES